MLHRVVKGDSLSHIAWYYQRHQDLLANLNDLKPPYLLQVNDLLYIPPDNSYGVLKKGITRDYIRELRGLKPCERRAKPGKIMADKLKVPMAEEVREKSKADSSILDSVRKITADNYKEQASRGAASAPSMKVARNKRFLWPVQGRYVRGFRTGAFRSHKGVDIAAPSGRNIRAAADGLVLYTGWMGNYGRVVLLDHGHGFATLYAHNSKNEVSQGQRVRQNQTIARIGSTGRSTGPHLHFEVRYNGEVRNPETFLPKFPGEPAIAQKPNP